MALAVLELLPRAARGEGDSDRPVASCGSATATGRVRNRADGGCSAGSAPRYAAPATANSTASISARAAARVAAMDDGAAPAVGARVVAVAAGVMGSGKGRPPGPAVELRRRGGGASVAPSCVTSAGDDGSKPPGEAMKLRRAPRGGGSTPGK